MPAGTHMTPEEFRAAGHAMVDWIADYMRRVDQLPVLARVAPGEIARRLPEHPPERGEDWRTIAADVEEVVLPGITHWQSPRFFAFFPANASGPSILGELLSAGLGVQGMLWATSPACTEIETRVLDWLAEMLGLPAAFRSTSDGGGVIQDTASSATLTALVTAREVATGFRSAALGHEPGLVGYASAQAHSSIDKAAMVAGVGRDRVRKVPADRSHAMLPDALAAAVRDDRAAGRVPFFVCSTLGTTSSHAMDPVRAIGEIARREGLWHHVDAAEAGAALVCPEHRGLAAGLDLADSLCFNPHKHLLTNFDCDAFFVRDRRALTRALSVLPAYLENRPSLEGRVFDYRDWHVPLGRRFRALKLWFVLRHYGVEGLRAYLREHVRLAQRFASWVDEHPDFEVCAPHPLTLVCFRHRGSDEHNRALMDRLNASGELYLTHTVLDGKLVLRMSIGAPSTREEHVARAWARIVEEAQRCR